MKIGVVVATFGSEGWRERGEETLKAGRGDQPQAEWLHVHAKTLGEARNRGARYLTLAHNVDWLVFLDADDSLDKAYLTEMADAVVGDRDIYRPNTIGVYPDGSTDPEPVMIPRRHLGAANCIVVGAMCSAQLFDEVGGFDCHLPALEDWDLWIRMVLAGSEVHDVPTAIYRVGVNPDSRNQPDHNQSNAYKTIRTRYGTQRGKLDIR